MLMANLKVKLCEIKPENYSLDLTHAKKLISKKLKIMIVI